MAIPDSSCRFSIEYDPRLVEDAVLLRLEGHSEEQEFRGARNRIYEVVNEEEREERFRESHARWFVRLQLGRPIAEALQEQPPLLRQARRCCVLPASSQYEEGADLHDWRGAVAQEGPLPTVILIRLKPSRLLDPVSLQPWLRHELAHVADMLDPAFEYERQLPSPAAGPALANLLRDRYRVLWDTWIDGRLVRRGWLPETVRDQRFAEFMAAFPMIGPQAAERFQQLFDSVSQTHHALMAFARNPGGETSPLDEARPHARICPLCRFPTFHLLDGAADPTAITQQEIVADFPDWQPSDGLCEQCAELYRTRSQSRSAEAALPGIR